jgi:death-on-curing protein
MDEPVWVDRVVVDAIHYDQLQQHGGHPGLGDENALESALARPRNKLSYEPASDIATLAAAYAFGLARSQGYRDGNKRVAFMTAYTFLGLNGSDLTASETDVVAIMLAVAEGSVSEAELAGWIRSQLDRPIQPTPER